MGPSKKESRSDISDDKQQALGYWNNGVYANDTEESLFIIFASLYN